MKKYFRYFFLFIVLILTSCNIKQSADFDKYNSLFIDSFSNEDDIEYKNITSLKAYFYNDTYYYDVCYINKKVDENKSLELLYIYKYNDLITFFNIQNEEECYKYFPNYYERFLLAKNDGIKHYYSSSEIESIINEFYKK